MIIIEIPFDDSEESEADIAYDLIDKILFNMGQVGTLSMCRNKDNEGDKP